MLAHVQVVINCQYSVAQMCTWEDMHARLFTHAVLDDVKSQNELTTICFDPLQRIVRTIKDKLTQSWPSEQLRHMIRGSVLNPHS